MVWSVTPSWDGLALIIPSPQSLGFGWHRVLRRRVGVGSGGITVHVAKLMESPKWRQSEQYLGSFS